MIRYSYGTLARVTGGRLIGADAGKFFEGEVALDSRELRRGDLFVALKGERFDAHAFVAEAATKGVSLAVVHRVPASAAALNIPLIKVKDTLEALGKLAAFHRRQKAKPLIAVTGSCGKTTAKDLIRHLFAPHKKILASASSENNAVGVPKTLLRWDSEELAVQELGTNHPGEIAHLARIAGPDEAVITLVAASHLEGLKSLAGVRKEKLSLLRFLKKGSRVYVNGECGDIRSPLLKKMDVIRTGFSRRFEFWASDIQVESQGTVFKFKGKTAVRMNLLGRHNVLNALLACAVAQRWGVPIPDILRGLESYQPVKGRMQLKDQGGVRWIFDGYNANPASLDAAVDFFGGYPWKGRKILVLADMKELGAHSAQLHRQAGLRLARGQFDFMMTVGTEAQWIARGAMERGWNEDKLETCASTEEARRALKRCLKSGDAVLVKGSRAMTLEKIMEEA